MFRDGYEILLPAAGAPNRACNDHGSDATDQTDADDPAQVHAQHRCHQDRAGRRRNEGVADRKASKQRDGIIQRGPPRPPGQGESNGNQDDESSIEKDGHRDDQAGDAQRPGGFPVAELAHHRYRQGLCPAGDFQDRPEHRAQTDQQCNPL